MRCVSSVLSTVAFAAAVACSGEDPVRSNEVVTVIILGGSERSIDALGQFRLEALALNALDQEVEPGTFRMHWNSSDVSIAAVTDGLVTVLRNGTVRIWASAFRASDTITLVIEQRATRVTLEQDTVVALTPDAQALSATALPTTEMRVIATVTDANGNRISSNAPISWTNLSPEYFAMTPNARGDTVYVNGTAAGAAATSLGTLRVAFEDFVADVPVQVASRYAVVRISTTPSGTALNPRDVTIPPGAAVVFAPADPAEVRGTGWKTGAIPGGGQEAQLFGTAGTYQYQVGSAMGTVIVQP